jgi:hypothetical protein
VRKTVVVSVRMPEALRDRVSRHAEEDVRTISQEIVWLLNYALDSIEGQRGRTQPFTYDTPSEHRTSSRLMKAAESKQPPPARPS